MTFFKNDSGAKAISVLLYSDSRLSMKKATLPFSFDFFRSKDKSVLVLFS